MFYFACGFRDEFVLLPIILKKQLLVIQSLTLKETCNIKYENLHCWYRKTKRSNTICFSYPL